MVTSSNVDVHTPLDTVHLKVALLPAASPVTVVIGDEGVVMVAVPLTSDQAPVPTAGTVAAIVKVELLHWV